MLLFAEPIGGRAEICGEEQPRCSSGGPCQTTTFLAPKGAVPEGLREASKEKAGGGKPRANFKRMIESEMQEKRANKLYFRYDEKCVLGHKCKDRTLQVLIVCDDKELEGGESEGVEEEEERHLDMTEVSLNSVVVFTLNHSMKVRGEMVGKLVVMLIDSGATHNFISIQVVDQLVDT